MLEVALVLKSPDLSGKGNHRFLLDFEIDGQNGARACLPTRAVETGQSCEICAQSLLKLCTGLNDKLRQGLMFDGVMRAGGKRTLVYSAVVPSHLIKPAVGEWIEVGDLPNLIFYGDHFDLLAITALSL